MEVIFDMERLISFLKDFHEVTGLRVGVYNDRFYEVAAYPVNHSGFCRIIRSREAGLARCKACDHAAFTRAKTNLEVYVYRCHAGLTEFISPIRDHSNVIGYLMIGQMRSEQDSLPEWNRMLLSLTELGLDANYLETAFSSLHSVSEAKVHAYARIVQTCAYSIWLDNDIRVQKENSAKILENYIGSHLSESLSIEVLSEKLKVGKTTLCSCAKKSFGMSIGELIRKRRVEFAKDLLQRTSEPVASIAEQVGIADYNYFTKVFKSETGVTPTAYRSRLHQANP